MQCDAHTFGCAIRRHALQSHPVQRQSHGIRGGAVDIHDPALDGAVVAKVQYRRGDVLRTQSGKNRSGRDQGESHKEGCDRLTGPSGQGQQ